MILAPKIFYTNSYSFVEPWVFPTKQQKHTIVVVFLKVQFNVDFCKYILGIHGIEK